MNVVFAIGCKRYRDPDVAQLKYPDRDAKRFVETVMETQDPDNIEKYLLHDEHENEGFRPTRANILYFLSRGERRDKSTELDFLFFYFSGHGWSSQDGTDYLLTSDSLVNLPEDTAISVPMLEGHLRNWEAKHAVLFIDACRTVMAGGKSITIEDESRVNVDSLCPPGMVTFCSCEPGQTSYEADPIHSGVFTEGICRALGDEGRCSTIQELDEYLNDRVPKISDTYGLPRQIPYSRVEPLAVQKALIVSQRTLETWHIQEGHEKAVQPSAETTTKEDSLGKYRELVEWVWTDEQLSDRDVQRLSALASDLDLSAATTADTEREVMGDTKEAILERQEEAIRQEERKPRQLDELYAQARTLHRDRKWQAVIDVFERIRAEDPGYPDPEGLMASARDALEAQERTREATGPYDEGQRNTDTEAVPQALDWVGILGQTWWALALRGLVFVVLGVIFWSSPLALSSDVVKAGWVYGGLMLVDGALALTTGIKIGRSGPRWLLIEGIISILAGLLVSTISPIVESLMRNLNLLYEIQVWAILILWVLAIGIIRVVTAMRLGRQVENSWLLIVSGALSVIFGLLALVVIPADDATKLPYAGIWALASGVVLTVFAFLARKRPEAS